MPTLTIDGKQVESSAGKMVIEAALENGIDVPHFCWHPALSVSGNCRMCLVEMEKAPKLVIACSTPVAEGQVIHTNNERVLKARQAIMEFLLINHPLDCPICDEAGQCKLQDYAFSHGRGESRFDEWKNHKDKRVPLGPEVLFDAERCITCSRCIRFADEVAHQPALTFVNRGDRVTIETFPGTQLDNPYAMNVIDICPVGALTSRDFRFKARVWDMSFNPSVCPGCSRGCNIHAGVRNNEILRLEPRTNMKVNKYWMCDAGRLGQFAHVNLDRAEQPTVAGTAVSWDAAAAAAAAALKGLKPNEVAFIGSGYATCEENYVLARFARTVCGTQHIDMPAHNDPAFADTTLRCADRTPNSRGAREAGAAPTTQAHDLAHILDGVRSGKIKALYVLDQWLEIDEESLAGLHTLIVHASNNTPLAARAHILFPACTYAENEGTFVNGDALVQYLSPAVATRGNQRTMGMKMSRLDKFGAPNDRWTHGALRDARPAWQILQSLARLMGTKWDYREPEDVFAEIADTNPGFRHMTYQMLDEYRGVTLGQGNRPQPHGFTYVPHDFRPQIMEDKSMIGDL